MLQVRDFQCTGHKVWDWLYVSGAAPRILFHRQWDGLIDVYLPSSLPGALGRANWWQLSLEGQSNIPFWGELCSVKHVTNDVVAMQGLAVEPVAKGAPSSFLEVLARSGGQWMWEDLIVQGEEDWIVQAIAESTVRVVTDGSYMEDLFPDVCSAAFILECSQGRGTISGLFTERSDDPVLTEGR